MRYHERMQSVSHPKALLPSLQTQPDWLQHPDLLRIWHAIDAGGPAPESLLVGGAVRAAIAGFPMPDDFDMATKLLPDEIMARGRKAGIGVHPTGIDHGTVTLSSNGLAVQVTTLRRDLKTDGRHAEIAFGADWLEDAKRRDFTFNTLLLDQTGNIYDPLGVGLNDLNSGRIVFVGEASARLREDYLRLLRFYRFWAQMGGPGFKPDAVTHQALCNAAAHMQDLSAERITAEINKILPCPQAVPVLQAMFNDKVLRDLPSESGALNVLALVQNYAMQGLKVSMATRYLALRPVLPEDMPRYLRLPKSLLAEMSAIKLAMTTAYTDDAKKLRQAAYATSVQAVHQALILRGASQRQKAATVKDWLAQLPNDWKKPVLPVKAALLMDKHGLSGGQLGTALKTIERIWIDSDFSLKPAALIKAAGL